MSRDSITRRRLVRTAAAVGVAGALAGCGGDGGDGGGDGGDGMDGGDTPSPTGSPTETPTQTPTDGGGDRVAATVAAGPGGNFVFEPEEVTISANDTVRWTFESPGHNVSGKPDAADEVSIPDGAEPFASYEGSNHFETVEEGATYDHRFETAGEYTYVCVPHVSQGMIGTVVVEE